MKKIRILNKRTGYILYYCPKHPKANKMGYIYEHRYVMEKKIGRLLIKKECIHHINENKSDNNIENLVLCKDSREHRIKYHKYSFKKLKQISKLKGEKHPAYKQISQIIINPKFIGHELKKLKFFYRNI